MAQLVGDFLIERLLEWNITRIFGFPEDGINRLMGALNRAKDKMDFMHRKNVCLQKKLFKILPGGDRLAENN